MCKYFGEKFGVKMNGRDGCCIARHAGSVSGYSMSKMDRIMQRFRPIAPKPAAAIGSFSSGSGSSSAVAEKADLSVKAEIEKRDCENYSASSVKERCTPRKRKASSEDSEVNGRTASSESIPGGDTAVTLLLLPETPDVKESPKREPQSSTLWLSFGNEEKHIGHGMEDPPPVIVSQAVIRQSVVGSWVKVECITDAWEHCDVYGLGHTDEERMMNLHLDTCPGFVSDGLNRVKWTNLAYKQMVQGDAAEEVWLVINKGVALPVGLPSFTCWVKVVKNPTISLTVPCDVWRMERGGFAWRLDAKAALSLGS